MKSKKTFMRVFMPILMPVLLCISSLLIYYGIDNAAGIYRWSDFIHIALRFLASIFVLVVIYQIVYIKFLGAAKYNAKFPPLKLVIAIAMIMPFFLLATQYISFLFVRLKGGVFVTDPEVESEWSPLFFGTLEAVFFAPILEELTMRVMMISQAQTRKGIIIAVIFSSLLFSFLHLSHFISHLLTAILYATVLIYTQNIWYPIICHALHNLSVSCLGFIQYFNPSLIETDVATGIVRADSVIVITFVIMFLGGILLLFKNKALIFSMFKNNNS